MAVAKTTETRCRDDSV